MNEKSETTNRRLIAGLGALALVPAVTITGTARVTFPEADREARAARNKPKASVPGRLRRAMKEAANVG